MKRSIVLFFTVALALAALSVGASATVWQASATAEMPAYPLEAHPFAGDVDANGELESADARLALRLSVGLPSEGYADRAAADYDGDGAVTPEDARLILRCAVGLIRRERPGADRNAYRIRVSSRFERFSKLGALIPLEVNAAPVADDGGTLPLWRLRSRADVEAFVKAYAEADMKSIGGMDVPAFLSRYDDKPFFSSWDLFVCYTVENSGSNLPSVYAPLRENGVMTFTVGSASPVIVTDDVADWFLFLPVDKSVTEGCTAFECTAGRGELLPSGEYKAARQGQSKWDYAAELVLNPTGKAPSHVTVGLCQGGENAFALVEEQKGGYRWTCETDAAVKEYDPACLLNSTGEEGACLWMREERIAFPDTDPDAVCMQLYTLSAREPGTYTLRLQLKRAGEQAALDETTVTVVVSDDGPYLLAEQAEPDERIAIVDYFGPFRPEEALSPTDNAGDTYHTCTFRGVIERVTLYKAWWRSNGGELISSDCDRTLLRVRVTDPLDGLTDRESVTLLYPFGVGKTENVPVRVEEGKEYWFLNCYLLDETYFANAKARSRDTEDPTLRMADAITGHAARSLVPVEDGQCTVFREYFTEEQLADPANPVSPVPGTLYVTSDEAFWRTRLLGLIGK